MCGADIGCTRAGVSWALTAAQGPSWHTPRCARPAQLAQQRNQAQGHALCIPTLLHGSNAGAKGVGLAWCGGALRVCQGRRCSDFAQHSSLPGAPWVTCTTGRGSRARKTLSTCPILLHSGSKAETAKRVELTWCGGGLGVCRGRTRLGWTQRGVLPGVPLPVCHACTSSKAQGHTLPALSHCMAAAKW